MARGSYTTREDDDDETKAKTKTKRDDEESLHAEKRVWDDIIWFTIRYVLKLRVSLFASRILSLDPWSL